MKPDWKDAPEWARFLAMDESGIWHWYEDKPEASDSCGEWLTMGEWSAANPVEGNSEWTETLERRP